MKPYTYLIGWSNLNKYYYGVRFAKNCTPLDLWQKYFTSSKYVKNFRKENGEPDIIQIRKIFDCATQARIYETKILKKLKVVNSEKWLNKTDNISIEPISVKWTQERKLKFSNSKLGKPSPNKGNKFSYESKQKMIQKRIGKYWFNNGLVEKKFSLDDPNINNWNRGRIYKFPSKFGSKHTEETRIKMSKSHIKRIQGN